VKVTFLQVALNGDRRHEAVPKSAEAIGREALASIRAGAHSVHVHAFDAAGRETLNAAECDAVVTAIRESCPGVPISLTTSATIIADPAARLAAVRGWTVLPDLVTANQGEDGITELCQWFLAKGVGIEAGLLSPDDARNFVASPIRAHCRRVLIEPLNPDPATALRDAEDMEAIVIAAGITLPQVHHGYDGSCWAVNRRALTRGHGIRTGLEDVAVLPDGTPTRSNGQLVEAARRMIAEVKGR